MRNTSKIVWGIALVALGIIWVLNTLDITNINIFFDGWWTLFIIVPCLIGLLNKEHIVGNCIGIALGVGLLLDKNDVLNFDFWELIFPVLVIAFGIKLIVGNLKK
ncbi:MAG: hypothetical protein IJY12_00085 [Clostridia bacterium]|nr:hypothetical protein [Clostridia bacterium]